MSETTAFDFDRDAWLWTHCPRCNLKGNYRKQGKCRRCHKLITAQLHARWSLPAGCIGVRCYAPVAASDRNPSGRVILVAGREAESHYVNPAGGS